MPKYLVQIARTETTVYGVEVSARNAEKAEELAYKKYEEGDYHFEDIVHAEECTHEIEEQATV